MIRRFRRTSHAPTSPCWVLLEGGRVVNAAELRRGDRVRAWCREGDAHWTRGDHVPGEGRGDTPGEEDEK